jgi:hypothetical protein
MARLFILTTYLPALLLPSPDRSLVSLCGSPEGLSPTGRITTRGGIRCRSKRGDETMSAVIERVASIWRGERHAAI